MYMLLYQAKNFESMRFGKMRQKCLVLLSLLKFKNVGIKVLFFSIANPSKVLMIKIKAQMS